MSWFTRMFGERIGSRAVEGLLLGMCHPMDCLSTRKEGWETYDVSGKTRTKLKPDGAHVDLYVTRTDRDTESQAEDAKSNYHFEGVVPYIAIDL